MYWFFFLTNVMVYHNFGPACFIQAIEVVCGPLSSYINAKVQWNYAEWPG